MRKVILIAVLALLIVQTNLMAGSTVKAEEGKADSIGNTNAVGEGDVTEGNVKTETSKYLKRTVTNTKRTQKVNDKNISISVHKNVIKFNKNKIKNRSKKFTNALNLTPKISEFTYEEYDAKAKKELKYEIVVKSNTTGDAYVVLKSKIEKGIGAIKEELNYYKDGNFKFTIEITDSDYEFGNICISENGNFVAVEEKDKNRVVVYDPFKNVLYEQQNATLIDSYDSGNGIVVEGWGDKGRYFEWFDSQTKQTGKVSINREATLMTNIRDDRFIVREPSDGKYKFSIYDVNAKLISTFFAQGQLFFRYCGDDTVAIYEKSKNFDNKFDTHLYNIFTKQLIKSFNVADLVNSVINGKYIIKAVDFTKDSMRIILSIPDAAENNLYILDMNYTGVAQLFSKIDTQNFDNENFQVAFNKKGFVLYSTNTDAYEEIEVLPLE